VNPLRRAPVLAWLAGTLACAVIVARTDFSADLSAFLPRSPSPEQQVLVEQLREGVVSRLILTGIEGDAPARLAQLSKRIAGTLRRDRQFASVDNGDESALEADRDFLWRNRYLLSPGVTAERYAAAGLRESLQEDLRMLNSPAGMLMRRALPSDPGGEMLRLLGQLEGTARPASLHGVWFSADGTRALLVAQTRAAGYDIDAQERALAAIRSAFADAGRGTGAKLLVAGPGVFSVYARERIKSDAVRFSLIATVLIGAMLLALYRSPRVLGLALLPVASGALAGVAAVSLAYGSVHGVTLGFGVTLIGEGVDYAIYLLTRITPGTAPRAAFERIWPTLRLGVLTSICGFSAMLLSGFSGLAQLGLFSIAGLVVAAAVTRWVLPVLLPGGFVGPNVAALARTAMSLLARAPKLRYPVLGAVLIAGAVLFAHRGSAWSDDLAELGPVSAEEKNLDGQLRKDLGAPDVRHLVVVHAADRDAALRACERIAPALARSVQRNWLQGFESPATSLPSTETQRGRQAALPPPEELRGNLQKALQDLPFRPGLFEPFLKEAAAARTAPPIDRAALDGTHFALKVDALLVKRGAGWSAMLPLRGVTHPEDIAREIASAAGTGAVLLDMKAESERMYRDYRREALEHALLGALAITVLLSLTLRSPVRVFEVLAPLVASVVLTAAGLLVVAGKLSMFHLVGLLLVVAVGSNYSLFFERRAASGDDRERTVVSLGFACLSTIIGFGLLAFSKVPLLSAIGSTVGLGAILALVFSAALSRRDEARAAVVHP
jgi:predicted exporter